MDTFLTIISYIIYIAVFLLAFFTLGFGIKLILDIEEITIGRLSSQILAVIFAAAAFYRLDAIPFLGEIIPLITIEITWVEWVFKIFFTVFILLLLITFYDKWREETAKIKEDAKIIYIMALFGISSMCFGYIA
jgi:hypothetical protein